MSKSRDIADSAATINFIDGLTSDAQGQLDDKAALDGSPTFTGTVTATAFNGDGSGLTGVDSLPSQTGNAGSYLTTDGTDASWAEISTSPTLQATASGTLANGNLVSINEDGKVSIVESSTPNVFDSFITITAAVFDSNSNKVIIAFVEGQDGQAIVGTVSGTSISFGTQVEWEAARALEISMVFDSNSNKVVIAYKNTAFDGAAIVGTVSGTDISFGTPVVFEAADVAWIAATFDSNSNKVVISYMDDANSDYGTSIVGTVSGTSISFGTPVVFRSAITRYIYSTFDSNSNKVVVSYAINNLRGEAIVGTVSGTSISFGGAISFTDAYLHFVPTFDSNSNKIVFAYPETGSGIRKAVVGTVSGTSISFGTAQIYDAVGTSYSQPSITFNSNTNEIVIAYINSDLSGSVVTGTVSGTDISFNAPVVFSSSATLNISPTFDSSNNKIVIAYMDDDNSDSGTAIVLNDFGKIQNYDSYIGISDGAYADGATANIQIVGSVDDAQSGLTVGKYYYVQQDGSLATTPDSISVFAGTSVAETKLIVKG